MVVSSDQDGAGFGNRTPADVEGRQGELSTPGVQDALIWDVRSAPSAAGQRGPRVVNQSGTMGPADLQISRGAGWLGRLWGRGESRCTGLVFRLLTGRSLKGEGDRGMARASWKRRAPWGRCANLCVCCRYQSNELSSQTTEARPGTQVLCRLEGSVVWGPVLQAQGYGGLLDLFGRVMWRSPGENHQGKQRRDVDTEDSSAEERHRPHLTFQGLTPEVDQASVSGQRRQQQAVGHGRTLIQSGGHVASGRPVERAGGVVQARTYTAQDDRQTEQEQRHTVATWRAFRRFSTTSGTNRLLTMLLVRIRASRIASS